MNTVEKYPIEPKVRGENGKLLVGLNRAPVPAGFAVRDQAFVRLPAGAAGGNHLHSCREAFVSSDPTTELHWLDSQGVKHIENFVAGEQLFVAVVPPLVPHAVYNPARHSIMLLEYRDGPVQNPQPAQVI